MSLIAKLVHFHEFDHEILNLAIHKSTHSLLAKLLIELKQALSLLTGILNELEQPLSLLNT